MRLPTTTPYYQPRLSDRTEVPARPATASIDPCPLDDLAQVAVTAQQRAAALAYLTRHGGLDLADALGLAPGGGARVCH